MKPFAFLFFLLSLPFSLIAQDSTQKVGSNYITLSEVILHKDLNVPGFVQRVKSDTSFYKAFKNLRIIGFKSWNDVRMLDKKGNLKAHLQSVTQQHRNDGCRSMEVLEESVTGDIYTASKDYNYYTLAMYASLFFTDGVLCGEDNVVGDKEFSVAGKKGIEKHKEQLKMLFFNPGKRIKGLPFMSNKTDIFSDRLSDDYSMEIDFEMFNGEACFVFRQTVLPKHESKVVIQSMTTWFRESDFEIMARNYELKYNAPVYDFDVKMEVEMTSFGNLTVPRLIRYKGNWKVMTKKRERGIFTATLGDFSY